jgi:hypothetical protein
MLLPSPRTVARRIPVRRAAPALDPYVELRARGLTDLVLELAARSVTGDLPFDDLRDALEAPHTPH